jgi:hypothetical protein
VKDEKGVEPLLASGADEMVSIPTRGILGLDERIHADAIIDGMVPYGN